MKTSPMKAIKQHRNNHCNLLVTFLIIVVSSTLPAYAKDYFILLSKDNNAPTPETVFEQFQPYLGTIDWALNSLNTHPPDSIKYLIDHRPKGDLLRRIQDYPDSKFAKMYRYLLLSYPDEVNDEALVRTLINDPYIENAALIQSYDVLRPDKLQNTKDKSLKSTTNKSFASDFLVDLNVISAWELSEGMGYIGALDIGMQKDHESLRAFYGSNYKGGNLLDGSIISELSYQSYQYDFGNEDPDIDTKEPVPANGVLAYCDSLDGADGFVTPLIAGHGTHVAGILAGKSVPNKFTGGVCKNCGLSMMKFGTITCRWDGSLVVWYVENAFPEDKVVKSIRQLVENGMGTINFSGGLFDQPSNECQKENPPSSHEMFCDAVALATERNALVVASAGNDRVELNLPASEIGTVAVGGFDEDGGFWNESPGPGGATDIDNMNYILTCPRNPSHYECGSNFGYEIPGQNLDVMAQAKEVFSIFYTGEEWIPTVCADDNDGLANDGYGKCTGTSMSAPQVAGIVQLMRSAHPLLPNGTYDPTLSTGIINVLNASSSQSTIGLGNDKHLGYGLPDARLALEKILGQANEVQLKTRLTPMFDLYSSGEGNNIYTPFSQVAVAFMYRENSYIPNISASTVSEFQEFWYDTTTDSFPDPTASFYVFTTNNNPFSLIKDMLPLRRMEKTTLDINNDVIGRNDTYAVNDTEIQNNHNAGYNYAGIEGYILPLCTPLPSCIPLDSTPLYRDESNSNNHKLIPASSAPNGSSVLLGYVYLNQDSDNDGLIDGQEIILGTNYTTVGVDDDTDGDGLTDAEEYPPAGVPVSDPLVNPNKLDWLPAVVGLVLG